MKDLNETHTNLFLADPAKAVSNIDTALKFLFADTVHGMNDKVAGDYTYEELVDALLSARRALYSDHGEEGDQ